MIGLPGIPFRLLVAVLAAGAWLALSRPLLAQDEPDAPNTIGAVGVSNAGVAIDAAGVLHHRIVQDPQGILHRRRFAEARAAWGDQDVARPSKLRKVSLTRLEAALRSRLGEEQTANDEMLHLAGLTRVRYVFYYPETRDIVIAGPAEGWVEALSGQKVGLNSGRPVLQLQDLIVALRAYPPDGRNSGVVGCSIDPTQEGLAKMQEFLGRIGGRATRNDTQFIVKGLRDSLGLQVITVDGVSPKTHLAQVMVEADYRMKLIGIGLERPPIKLASYVDRVNPSAVARNAMQRWFFVPDYECVKVAEDGLAMQLVGEGVQLVGENEVVGSDGSRGQAARGNRASELFVKGFTKAYPQLAQRAPAFAQLRNCIDLLVAAAFIQDQDYYGKAGWNLELFGSEQDYPVETLNAPREVASAVNSIWRRNRLMTPIGGGVVIEAPQALRSENLLDDEGGKVAATRASIELDALPADRWWWD